LSDVEDDVVVEVEEDGRASGGGTYTGADNNEREPDRVAAILDE